VCKVIEDGKKDIYNHDEKKKGQFLLLGISNCPFFLSFSMHVAKWIGYAHLLDSHLFFD